MPLKTSDNRTIARIVQYCLTPAEQAKGLMFSWALHDKCLIFSFGALTVPTFHMLFVFFPIDMIFLDDNKRIIHLRSNVAPFTPLIRPPRPARYVIELASGLIAKFGLREGGLLKF
jgi:uncharacterized membrane protein (UPF0127 family)